MKKTLLKINNMKRFTRWLDQNNVHLEIVRTFFDTPWLMWPNERKSIERRLESTEQRDKFCKNRAKLINSKPSSDKSKLCPINNIDITPVTLEYSLASNF